MLLRASRWSRWNSTRCLGRSRSICSLQWPQAHQLFWLAYRRRVVNQAAGHEQRQTSISLLSYPFGSFSAQLEHYQEHQVKSIHVPVTEIVQLFFSGSCAIGSARCFPLELRSLSPVQAEHFRTWSASAQPLSTVPWLQEFDSQRGRKNRSGSFGCDGRKDVCSARHTVAVHLGFLSLHAPGPSTSLVEASQLEMVEIRRSLSTVLTLPLA